MWSHIDENGNGKINLGEFRDWAGDLLKLSIIEDKFNV
jgi:hypothetical protein